MRPTIEPDDAIPGPRPRIAGWSVSIAITVVWAAYVVVRGHVDRVLEHWEATATMLVGSFLAGSSPEGGGAVAFPVFTKALDVAAPTARSFGLFIQAVGMTVAVVAIVANRRPLHRPAVAVATPAAVVGFVAMAAFGSEWDVAFAPSVLGVGWVKAAFSIVLATTSVLMVMHLRHDDDDHRELRWTPRFALVLGVVAAAGGVLSAVTGTGANVLVFLFLVVLADVSPKAALPTAIVVMAAVSIVGFVVFGLMDGQLDVSVVGDQVTAVGGVATDLGADRADLFGMWLAAVPVVAWGAPLGSLAAAIVRERTLVAFVAVLAAIEVITTVVLVEEIRTDPALAVFLVTGLVVAPMAFVVARRHRRAWFATEPIVSR